MCIGSVDGQVHYLQVNTKRLLLKFAHSVSVSEDSGEEAHSVECVAICKSKSTTAMKWAASGGSDGTLKVWDLNSGVLRCSCQHPSSSVVALEWHPVAHHLVVTAALDFIVRVWDARAGSVVRAFTGHTDMVISLALRSLDAPQAVARTPVEGTVFESASEAVDTLIVSVSDDGTAKVFAINAADNAAAR